MTRPNSMDITFVVDRSGSMSNIAKDMMGGFDSLIEEQRKVKGECKVTLVQFDDRYEIDYTARPLSDVPPLRLVPRGSTALLDAVGKTIVATGERLAALPEKERPSQVNFVIITDGAENASVENTLTKIKRMIEHQTDKYQWNFAFLGANIDAFAVGHSLGIAANNLQYDASSGGSRGAYRNLSRGLASHRVGGQSVSNSLVDQDQYKGDVDAVTPDKK